MKRYDILLITLIASVLSLESYEASAQTIVVPDGYVLADSLVYRYMPGVDTLLAGKDIFAIMPRKAQGGKADVEIFQSQKIINALKKHIQSNVGRPVSGYRVRIFFDNRQSARTDSEDILKRFESMFRDVKAYRTYVNPYFKVTVGDFRTKSEAMELLSRIKRDFPSAFVVKENISYPVVDENNLYVIDTIKVLRPVGTEL